MIEGGEIFIYGGTLGAQSICRKSHWNGVNVFERDAMVLDTHGMGAAAAS